MEASTESAFLDPVQSASDFAKKLRSTVEILDGYLPLDGTLSIFEFIGAPFDGDAVATAQRLLGVDLFRLEDCSESV
jgi:hypothetical protein